LNQRKPSSAQAREGFSSFTKDLLLWSGAIVVSKLNIPKLESDIAKPGPYFFHQIYHAIKY